MTSRENGEPRVSSGRQLADEVRRQLEGEPECIFEDGCFVFPAGGGYAIDTERCSRAEELLGWIVQLEGKSWVKPSTIRAFVLTAAERLGIAIRFPA
jgi:hypothetical protein